MLLKPNILDKKAFEIVSIHINTIVKDFLEAFLDEYISYGFDEDDVDYISEVFPCNSDIKDKRTFLKEVVKECGNLDEFFELTPLKCFIIFKTMGRELQREFNRVSKDYDIQIRGTLTDYPNCKNIYRYEEFDELNFFHLDNFSHFSYFNILRMGDESERNYVLDVLRSQAHKISEEKSLDEEEILTNLMRNIEDILMYPIAYFDEYEFMELEED